MFIQHKQNISSPQAQTEEVKVHTGGGRFDPSTNQIWANWGAGTEGGAGHMYGLYEASRDPQWPPLLDLGVRGPVCQRSRLSEVHPHHMRWVHCPPAHRPLHALPSTRQNLKLSTAATLQLLIPQCQQTERLVTMPSNSDREELLRGNENCIIFMGWWTDLVLDRLGQHCTPCRRALRRARNVFLLFYLKSRVTNGLHLMVAGSEVNTLCILN